MSEYSKWVKYGTYRKDSRAMGDTTAMEKIFDAMADARAEGYDDFKITGKGTLVLWARKETS